uniref:Putative secreted protein n=2 Tax=Anopheles triannulatus TaxID=58253 RepID=A0A2M4AW49_9DIPT
MRPILSIFVLLAALCVVFVTVDALTCQAGEEYRCGHTDCERKCENRFLNQTCDLPCKNGCYCAKNFVRFSRDRCKPDFYCIYEGRI